MQSGAHSEVRKRLGRVGDIKVGVGKGYDGHVVKGISKTTIFEKNDALSL